MYDELIAALRFCDNGECDGCCKYIKGKGTECYTLLRDAADAIEERDRYALTLQHEMMAEAESHIALVEKLNKQVEELSKRVPPVPHGRLIDADAFFDDLLFPSKQFEQGMRELIGDAPTVIPAEEDV